MTTTPAAPTPHTRPAPSADARQACPELFDVCDHASYTDPYVADVTVLLTDALAGASA